MQQAANTRFQVEDEGAPVQVMGMLEAAGLRFDHLWIMGLHDEALPAPANPNPFLPTSLQRQHRLPHSSPERELEFANKLMERLLASAPDVVLSYPETDGDRALTPSPLVAGGSWLDGDSEKHPHDWITRMRASAVFEEMDGRSRSGASAKRLNRRRIALQRHGGVPVPRFRKTSVRRPAAGRGRSWIELSRSRNNGPQGAGSDLARTGIARAIDGVERRYELEALIARGADAAVAKLGPGIGRDLEKQRLQKLLPEWLGIEKSRADIHCCGHRSRATDRDWRVADEDVRADRVDALPDGREIILDYKTGQLKSNVLGKASGPMNRSFRCIAPPATSPSPARHSP